MIFADFKSILISENYVKQTPDESYTNKCQNHVSCRYDYKLICVDGQFSYPFRPRCVS